MSKNIPKSHLFSEEDLPLYQCSYTYALASVWIENDMANKQATFDLLVRNLPKNRNYLIAGGLEEIITWIKKLRFTDDQIKYLKDHNLVTEKGEKYFRNFHFTGTIHAMPEGTLFFGNEPFIRITAPIAEAAIIEGYIMSAAVSNILFFTKAARLVLATENKFLITTGPLRAHGFESSFKATRAAVLCGASSPATPSFNLKYNMDVDKFWVNSQHLFVTSFPSEMEAFRSLSKIYPDNCGFLIDTYDAKQGIENAIIIAKQLQQEGHHLASIYIDSGDRTKLVNYTRKRFREEGITKTKITVAGGITEYKVAKYAKANLQCDNMGSLEELMTTSDAPKLDVVYKLAELRDNDSVLYTAKLTPGKESYPGRKQVFRNLKNNKLDHDIIGLEDENLGTPLLEKVMEKGEICKPLPDWSEIQKYISSQYDLLPDKLKNLNRKQKYRVDFSPKLLELFNQIKLERRASQPLEPTHNS